MSSAKYKSVNFHVQQHQRQQQQQQITINNLSETTRPVLDYILAHAGPDERPYLKVEIFGKKLLGLLDTGATHTIVGSSGWKILSDLNIRLNRNGTLVCKVANDQKTSVLGSARVPIKLMDRVKLIDVIVVPDIHHPLILGINFFVSMGIVPNLRKDCWHFDTSTVDKDYQLDLAKVTSVQGKDALTENQRESLDCLVDQYFELMGDKLGCTSLVEHHIQTNATPIKQRYYRVSPAVQAQIDWELDRMLAEGVVEKSSSAWSSPILLVKKKDGSFRFCVDYRKLNSVTQKDAYPIPFIDSILDKLRDARYLSSLDVKSAYWQVKVAESSRDKTAFTVPSRGLFQFKRMPFGLSNSPATWQRLIDQVLGPELEPFVFVYLDDVVICTPTFEQHLEILEEVFKRLVKAGLTLSREKCQFCRGELRYLGYTVDSHGLHVDPAKVQAILDIPTPRNVSEVRRVIGTASWYRRFIPGFSTIIAPLTALLKKGRNWSWTEECDVALRTIKERLISAPILSRPDFNLPFYVQTDASAYGLGAVLSQHHPDGEYVICYLSRSLTRNERNYSTTERECLAVLWAVEHLRCYLEGYRFYVITDHHSLVWLNNLKEPTGRLARWAVRMQQFDFQIIHRKGKDHIVPDMLSRSVPEVNSSLIEKNPSVSVEETTKDRWYLRMLERVNHNPLRHSKWRVKGAVLYKYVEQNYSDIRGDVDAWKIVLPKEKRRPTIVEHHDDPKCGHAGVYKTYERLAQRFYWPKMR